MQDSTANASRRYEDQQAQTPAIPRNEDPFLPPEVIALFASQSRREIVGNLQDRAMTPSEYANEFGGTASKISRHCRALVELGWLEEVGPIARRGRLRQQYRAAKPFLLESDAWDRLPSTVRASVAAETFAELSARVVEALTAGSFEAESDRHLAWAPLNLDREAWEQLISAQDRFLEWVTTQLAPEAEKRLSETDCEGIPATMAQMTFRSPPREPYDERPPVWIK